ncbi:regulatory protein, ArsR [Oceanicola granulosus HTCC2516]|uniref:Regulatory protein, ArsR n=1 Tax=Oceanicola granulosus (strain ATCC BAA-861 / DSM 15982 / KCTC 12143 / HTCC2516) TaxID=314256 RepID=Q2CAP4_OCEGH|nr:metalloregulator ArsR/SmtB family transcription factor [Oceanicola granulosus]EAR49750.1 regulatory protein, ArsR [Oceanicola granulosus HTCC2516]
MANYLDSFFSALGDPTRRAVIARLASGPAPVGELHAPHDIALPTFLRHLKVLEASGLVRSEKVGRVRIVHIEAGPLAAAEDWLTRQRRIWEGRLDRLDALAERLERDETSPPDDKDP